MGAGSNRLWVLIGICVFIGLGTAYVTSDSGPGGNLFSSGREVTVSDFTLDEKRIMKGAGSSMVIPIKTTGTIVSATSRVVTMVDIDVTIYSCAKGNAETLEGCEIAVEARISPAGRIQPDETKPFESTIYLSPKDFPIAPPIRWTYDVLRVHKR